MKVLAPSKYVVDKPLVPDIEFSTVLREEAPLCNKSACLGPKVIIRLKGEISVAIGTAHRLVSEAAPSLKDLHRSRLFFFKYPSAYAPSELDALTNSPPRGKPRG